MFDVFKKNLINTGVDNPKNKLKFKAFKQILVKKICLFFAIKKKLGY